MPVRLCNNCRDYVLIGKPSEDYIWIPPGTYSFFAQANGERTEFNSLGCLEEYIDDNPNCMFGFSSTKGMDCVPFIALSGKDKFYTLQKFCINDYWNKIPIEERNEENTIYFPKLDWLKRELKNCKAEIISLKEKRELLVSLTKTSKKQKTDE